MVGREVFILLYFSTGVFLLCFSSVLFMMIDGLVLEFLIMIVIAGCSDTEIIDTY